MSVGQPPHPVGCTLWKIWYRSPLRGSEIGEGFSNEPLKACEKVLLWWVGLLWSEIGAKPAQRSRIIFERLRIDWNGWDFWSTRVEYRRAVKEMHVCMTYFEYIDYTPTEMGVNKETSSGAERAWNSLSSDTNLTPVGQTGAEIWSS